jgi:hypothetical protein
MSPSAAFCFLATTNVNTSETARTPTIMMESALTNRFMSDFSFNQVTIKVPLGETFYAT